MRSRSGGLALLFAGIGAACALLIWKGNLLFPSGTMARIYVDGQCVEEIDLSRVSAPYTVAAGSNVVLVEAGAIRMQEATCPDQLCVHQGALRGGGVPIVCLPNRVVITVGDQSGPDGVTQ